jgi:NAD(P)-dependent dehydrogenase (short-subunit alcohol dehydrogenase family)
MVAGDRDAIINVSSTSSIRPNPETAHDGAAKAGLNILRIASVMRIRAQGARQLHHVRAPHTDISKGWSRTDDFIRRAKEMFPLQRAGEPEEVVGAAMYFASSAASFTTGAVLMVDGARRIRWFAPSMNRETECG